MPDIAMCQNSECGLRQNCYRFIAEPSERQAYTRFEPKVVFGEPGLHCDKFIEAKDGSQVRRLKIQSGD